MSEHGAVGIRIDDGIMRIVKTNPEASYGISLAMCAALTAAIDQAAADDGVRAVLIDAGGPGFHRGAVMVTELKPRVDDLGPADFRELVRRGQALGRAIAALPKPVLGIARAGALGGGLELLLRCDFLYALEDARFSFPEVMLGFVAAWGGTQWGGRMMPFRRAQEMLLLGRSLSGREAADAGLVTKAFETAVALDAHIGAVLARLRYCSPAAFAQTKACLAATWQGPLDHGEGVELEAEVAAMGSGDFRLAYAAWLAGRTYNFQRGMAEDKAPPLA